MRLLWCLENIEKVRIISENISHLASLTHSLFSYKKYLRLKDNGKKNNEREECKNYIVDRQHYICISKPSNEIKY